MDMKMIVIDGEAQNWEEAIRLTAGELCRKGCVTGQFSEHCIEREKKFPTGLEMEVPIAIPHTESEYVVQTAICFLRLKNPVRFVNMEDAEGTLEVKYVLNLAIKEKEKQVPMLQKVIEVFQDGRFLKQASMLTPDEFRGTLLKRLMLND